MCDPKGEDIGKTGDKRGELDFGSEGETRKGGAKEEVRKRIKWNQEMRCQHLGRQQVKR